MNVTEDVVRNGFGVSSSDSAAQDRDVARPEFIGRVVVAALWEDAITAEGDHLLSVGVPQEHLVGDGRGADHAVCPPCDEDPVLELVVARQPRGGVPGETRDRVSVDRGGVVEEQVPVFRPRQDFLGDLRPGLENGSSA